MASVSRIPFNDAETTEPAEQEKLDKIITASKKAAGFDFGKLKLSGRNN